MKILPVLTSPADTINGQIEPSFARLVATGKAVWSFLSLVGEEVAFRLTPKFEFLWTIISTSLIPSFVRLCNAILPLLPIVGGTLLVAVGLLVDGINIVTFGFSGRVSAVALLVQGFTSGTPVVWALAGAFTGRGLAMGINAIINAVNTSMAVMSTVTV